MSPWRWTNPPAACSEHRDGLSALQSCLPTPASLGLVCVSQPSGAARPGTSNLSRLHLHSRGESSSGHSRPCKGKTQSFNSYSPATCPLVGQNLPFLNFKSILAPSFLIPKEWAQMECHCADIIFILVHYPPPDTAFQRKKGCKTGQLLP